MSAQAPSLPAGMREGSAGRGRGRGRRRADAAARSVSADQHRRHVEHAIPESAVFTALQDLERRVDGRLKRRRAELVEALAQPPHTRKRLRIYVRHEHAYQSSGAQRQQEGPQPEAQVDGAQQEHTSAAQGAGDPPQWSLHIVGRLVDAEGPQPPPSLKEAQLAAKEAHKGPCLTTMLETVRVELQPAAEGGAAPEGGPPVVVWQKARHSGPARDAFTVRRAGAQPVKARLTLAPDYLVPRFKLASPELAAALKVKHDTKQGILAALSRYCEEKGLFDDRNGYLRLDSVLAAVAGKEEGSEVAVADGPDLIAGQLVPLPPLTHEHEIDLTGPAVVPPEHCIDIDVELPAKGYDRLLAGSFLEQRPEHRQREANVAAYDQHLSGIIARIDELKRRRAVLLGFASNPAEFLDAVIAEQAGYEVRKAHSGGSGFEVVPLGEAQHERWFEEASIKFLQGLIAD